MVHVELCHLRWHSVHLKHADRDVCKICSLFLCPFSVRVHVVVCYYTPFYKKVASDLLTGIGQKTHSVKGGLTWYIQNPIHPLRVSHPSPVEKTLTVKPPQIASKPLRFAIISKGCPRVPPCNMIWEIINTFQNPFIFQVFRCPPCSKLSLWYITVNKSDATFLFTYKITFPAVRSNRNHFQTGS